MDKTCRNGHPPNESRITPKGYKRCRICERIGRNKYYNTHKERSKINALNDRRLRHKKRLDILKFLGDKCVKCGFDDPRALNVDHVYGGGTQESTIYKSLSQKYSRIKNNPELFQLLCANCNTIKIWENGERKTKY